MFRDLFAVPDFLSSGWKIDYITDKITENVAQKTGLSGEDLDERTKDLALFLRLTRNLSDANDFSTRPEIWRRIAEIRPEEMVRLYRERTMDENGAVNPALERQLGNFFSGSAFDGFRVYKTGGNQTTEIDGIATYDKFKQEFGAIIQLVRQNAYNTDFRAIRIGETGERGLSDADKAIIAKYFGGGAAGLARVEQLQRMYAHFTEVATAGTVEIYKEGEILPGGRVIKKGDIHIGKAKSGSGVIHDLLDFDTFEDIYTRTLLVDDALLGILDRPSETILPLSETWTPGGEVAQDPLVRNFGDLEHAANAAAKLIGFVYTEDMKARLEAAMEFAEEASQYGGQTTRSECIRYTVGTLLEMQKIPIAWDALGVGKLPFRQVMTIIERIYGPHAQTMSRGDLRKELDSRRSVLSPEAYRELEHILEVTPEDTLKLRGLSLVFFLIFAAFDLGVAAIDVNSLTPGGKK